MRNKHLISILILLALLVPAVPAHAASYVTVCDESHFLSALQSSDTVYFKCNGTITLTKTITLSSYKVIDGYGYNVTISGNNAVQLFIVNSGVTVYLRQLTFANGRAQDGGGAISNHGDLRVFYSTFTGNTAVDEWNGWGGAIEMVWSNSKLQVGSSTFIGNHAAYAGGAIGGCGTMDIWNSTFVNNTAEVAGGAIHNKGYLTVENSTFSGNSGISGAVSTDQYGDETILKNTIVANSTGIYYSFDGNCYGLITDDGGNLSYPDTKCPGINANPLLGPLQNNGGWTQTMALGAGSPAIDAANDATCAASPVNGKDQRGITRPQGLHCDIGAVEQRPFSQPHPQFIDIDVKPVSDPNSVNCQNENGIIAVAILTTDTFDATTVDHTSVVFQGAKEAHVDKKTGEPVRHVEDVDGDGDMDLVFHFRMGDTHLTCLSFEGALWGETFAGVPILGTDLIRMVNGG